MNHGRFEGRDCDGPLSGFIVDAAAGEGPSAHVHPYPETFVIFDGSATFTIDGSECRAAAGDVLTVPAGTAHGFAANNPEGVRMIGIHASTQIAQSFLGTGDEAERLITTTHTTTDNRQAQP